MPRTHDDQSTPPDEQLAPESGLRPSKVQPGCAAGYEDLTLAAKPDVTDEERRRAREWARRVLREARERNTPERRAALRAQLDRGRPS
ncbi:hypothetical protein [Catenuloplanes atrovinosus]|uniref:Uncharacterized protein n=1 Tax=Catenuloplanes atrovinosus TaxID=137266 RepID=A0AAE3YW59_9ACTN|nr:hypothetical protein [Catenuloplanes atrovinosus]MDR7280973.1 hypothetical protein [Catenuloplanes atrovinosus]